MVFCIAKKVAVWYNIKIEQRGLFFKRRVYESYFAQ